MSAAEKQKTPIPLLVNNFVASSGGQTDHTRSGDTGRGGRQHCDLTVSMRGRRPRRLHIFEVCQLFFSLRVSRTTVR